MGRLLFVAFGAAVGAHAGRPEDFGLSLMQRDAQVLLKKPAAQSLAMPKLDTAAVAEEVAHKKKKGDKKGGKKGGKKGSNAEPSSTGAIAGVNDTASAVIEGAAKTMASLVEAINSSLNAFTDSLEKVNSTLKMGGDAANDVLAYVDTVASSTTKARSALQSSAESQQEGMDKQLDAFRSLLEAASSSVEAATQSTDVVVASAKNATDKSKGVGVMLMRCCTQHATKASVIWNWWPFGGGAVSACDSAKSSIAAANVSVAQVSEGVSELEESVSELLHNWLDDANTSMLAVQAEVDMSSAPSDAQPLVTKALSSVLKATTQATEEVEAEDSSTAKAFTSAKKSLEKTTSALGELDLQATAACGQLEKLKKTTSSAAPCDHHC